MPSAFFPRNQGQIDGGILGGQTQRELLFRIGDIQNPLGLFIPLLG